MTLVCDYDDYFYDGHYGEYPDYFDYDELVDYEGYPSVYGFVGLDDLELYHDLHGSDGCGINCVSRGAVGAAMPHWSGDEGSDVYGVMLYYPGPVWTSRCMCWNIVLWV